jgi:hypothetical protein
MLVSVSSFLPIIIVGPISDWIGTATVMLLVAIGLLVVGVASVLVRRPIEGLVGPTADPHAEDPFAAALGADRPTWRIEREPPTRSAPSGGGAAAIAPSAPTPDPVGMAGPADQPDRD